MSGNVLTRLRSYAAQLGKFHHNRVQEISRSLIAEIDMACESERFGDVIPDLSRIPVNELLGEIARRLRSTRCEVRELRDRVVDLGGTAGPLCNKCGKSRCRAKGLCMRCYQRMRNDARRKSHG